MSSKIPIIRDWEHKEKWIVYKKYDLDSLPHTFPDPYPRDEILCVRHTVIWRQGHDIKSEYSLDSSEQRLDLFRDLLSVNTDKDALTWAQQYGLPMEQFNFGDFEINLDSFLQAIATAKWLNDFISRVQEAESQGKTNLEDYVHILSIDEQSCRVTFAPTLPIPHFIGVVGSPHPFPPHSTLDNQLWIICQKKWIIARGTRYNKDTLIMLAKRYLQRALELHAPSVRLRFKWSLATQGYAVMEPIEQVTTPWDVVGLMLYNRLAGASRIKHCKGPNCQEMGMWRYNKLFCGAACQMRHARYYGTTRKNKKPAK